MIQDVGYLFFRVGFAGLFLVLHGMTRLVHFNLNATFIGITSMLIEFGAALLVVCGLATRIMAAAVVAFLVFYFFRYQARLPWVQNELSLVYIMGFSAIAVMGPGRFSLDSFFGWFKRR